MKTTLNYVSRPESLDIIGTGHFLDLQRFDCVQNSRLWLNKPKGGLWLSHRRQNSWSDWCHREEFDEELLVVESRVELNPESLIILIDSREAYIRLWERFGIQINNLDAKACDSATLTDLLMWECGERKFSRSTPLNVGHVPAVLPLDFEAIARHAHGLLFSRSSFNDGSVPWDLHAWDCDTLLILRPAAIRKVQHYLSGRQVHVEAQSIAALETILEQCRTCGDYHSYLECCSNWSN